MGRKYKRENGSYFQMVISSDMMNVHCIQARRAVLKMPSTMLPTERDDFYFFRAVVKFGLIEEF